MILERLHRQGRNRHWSQFCQHHLVFSIRRGLGWACMALLLGQQER
jgi:hypothetical protein